MTFISLFSDEHGFVATSQRVYSADELSALDSVIEQAEQLELQLGKHDEVLMAAATKAAEHGYREAYEKAQADVSEELAQKLHRLHEAHAQELQAVKQRCAELAVEIVRKIAGNTDPLVWIQAQAEQAANDLVDEPALKLRVSGSQVDALRQRLATSENQAISGVIVDDTLADGACELETASGRIDIGLDTQLNSVLNAFETAPISNEHSAVSQS